MEKLIGYILLTFFINEYLVRWDNCAASKQANLYMFYFSEPVRGGFPPRTGSLRLRTAYAGKVIPSTRHAKPGMARESRRTTSWQPRGGTFTPSKGVFHRSVTRRGPVRHQTLFGDGLDRVR